jgi:hypothetical protein
MVAYAILGRIGKVGMRGSEDITNVVVVITMLIGVAHKETDGTPGGISFKHTTEYLHMVFFFTSCSEFALPWATACQLRLDEIHVHLYACWHTIYHATYARSVALTKTG